MWTFLQFKIEFHTLLYPMGRRSVRVAPATKQKARKAYDDQRRLQQQSSTPPKQRQKTISLLKIFTNNLRAKVLARSEPEPEVCDVCKKTFETLEEYEKHCAYSVIHALNQTTVKEKAEKELQQRLTELSSFDMIFESPDTVPEHQMTLRKEARKFLWRTRQHCVIFIGQNKLGQCCLHVFDPTQSTMLKKDTALFLFADAWALTATSTKLGYGPLLPESVFSYMLDCVEIGLNRIDQSLVLLTPGVPHLEMNSLEATEKQRFVVPFLFSEAKTKYFKPVNNPDEFSNVSKELQVERSHLRRACNYAQEILAQTDRVLSHLRADRESVYQISTDGDDLFTSKQSKSRLKSFGKSSRTSSFFRLPYVTKQ